MRTLWRDLRYGWRVLRTSPAFTAVAVLTLMLGLALTTTVFSWIDTLLLRPLSGVSAGHQLVTFESVEPGGEGHNISYLDYLDYRHHLKLVAGLAVSDSHAFSLGEGERAERVWGELVSGNFFDVLGVRAFLGRFFLREEQGDQPVPYPVAVISHRLWRSRFQADSSAVGRTLRVNRRELTIVGVAPPDFYGTSRGRVFEMWVPLRMGPQLNLVEERLLQNRKARMLHAIARLQPGVALAQARAEVRTAALQLARAHPATNEGFGATLLRESERSVMVRPLQILMAMCGVVLLIACFNVANLLLARATARQTEVSIRLALGASRWRLARQLLTEALLLAGLGALAGAPLAMWMGRSVVYLLPQTVGPLVGLGVQMNWAVLGFTLLISIAAALLAGLSPALHAVRSDVSEALKAGGRGATAGARMHRMRGLFVISEVALALAALVGAGLFLRSFQNARAIRPGFEARNVLVARFHLSASGYTAEQRGQFCLRLREQLEAVPGLAAVSYADTIPLGFGLGPGAELEIEGYVPGRGENMTIPRSLVASGYFALLRIPLLEGRDFTPRDEQSAPPVVIVNQSFARRFFPGGSPLGRRLRAWGRWSTVAGVVKDSKYYHLTEAPRPYFYAPLQQSSMPAEVAFYVRSAVQANAAITTLRREAAAAGPEAGAFDAMPLPDYIAAPLFPQRIAASLLSVLGAVSLLLAAVGLYSVVAHAVSQRTQEIGLRMALGARPRDVLLMVVRQGMALTLAGLAAGLGVALAGVRLVAGTLVNVSPVDPLSFAGAGLFLGVVALLASLLPAWRATRIPPFTALRCQ